MSADPKPVPEPDPLDLAASQVSEWWVFAAEYALITHFTPEWNASGFGSKVPGVGRPGTDRVSRWDARFPKKRNGTRQASE